MANQEFIIVFQIGNVEYLKGNCFYTAKVQQFVQENGTNHYLVSLDDDVLVRFYGRDHDYYYYKDDTASFSIGKNDVIMDLHSPIMKALDRYHKKEP